MRYGMVVDLKRCVGCNSCTVMCKVENGTPPGVLWARVLRLESGDYPARRLSLPVLCMHCKDPPCQKACPTGATIKRPDGIVYVDTAKCIGCRYCMMACPYQARYFNDALRGYFPGQGFTPYEVVKYKDHPPGVVSKCHFCKHRVDQGLQPACVANCIAKARYFGDLDDPNSEVSQIIRTRRGDQLHADLGTDPSVYYLPP